MSLSPGCKQTRRFLRRSTIFSVLGGMLGYLIGAYFFDFAMNIVEFYNYEKEVIDLKRALSQGGSFYTWLGILFLAGFTPLPYKVFTIASGLISFNFPIFVLISLISRGLRFFIVSYLSKFMTLQAGDIITTGTPPAVGMGKKPQVFLKEGDTIRLSIDNLGEQNSKVVAE